MSQGESRAATRKILIAGGGFTTVFIRYIAELTGKPRPRICYLPTAAADSPEAIINFYVSRVGERVVERVLEPERID